MFQMVAVRLFAILQGCMNCNDKQGCCHLPTESSSAAEDMPRVPGKVAVSLFGQFKRLYVIELSKPVGVAARTGKTVVTFPLTIAVLQRARTGSKAWC